MSTKKTIKINPDYFKRSNNKKSRSVSKKMKKIKQKKSNSMIISKIH